MGALLRSALLEAFDLDGRLVTTLRLLVTRPGALSIAFSENRRAAFTSPLRLCIATGLLFFFLASLAASPPQANDAIGSDGQAVSAPLRDDELASLSPYLQPAERSRLRVHAETHPDARDAIRQLNAAMDTAAGTPLVSPWFLRLSLPAIVTMIVAPEAFLDRVNERLPLAMFGLLPAYAAVLWLLFRRPPRYYVEHVVFALHVHAFGFLVLGLGSVVPAQFTVLAGVLSSAALLATGLYVLFAMRTYYDLSWLAATWRWLLAGTCYLIMLAPALLFVLALTIVLG